MNKIVIAPEGARSEKSKMMKLEFLGLDDSTRVYLEEKGINVTEVLPDYHTIIVSQVIYDVFEFGKRKEKMPALQVVTNDYVAYILKDEFREVKIIL